MEPEEIGRLSSEEVASFYASQSKAEQLLVEIGSIEERKRTLLDLLAAAREQARFAIEEGVRRLGIPDGVPYAIDGQGVVRRTS